MNALARVHPAAANARATFHADIVQEVAAAVGSHPVVVVGMGWNPVVKRARALLQRKEVPYHYVGYGNYASKWKERLAIKLWSGWPTFPQVYVHGMLVGGASDLEKLMDSGEFARLLEQPPA